MDYASIASEIVTKAVAYFGPTLHGVLLYGSTISPKKQPNDLDMVFVLNKRESPADLQFIDGQIGAYSIEMDLQIINTKDIHPDSFSHDSHGQFFIPFLRNAQVLYGENPFLQLYPAYTAQLTSVLQKSQYYYFRAKKIQASTEINITDARFHRKKLLLMLADFWLIYTGTPVVLEEKSLIETVIATLTGTTPETTEMDFLTEQSDAEWPAIFAFYQRYYFAITDLLSNKPSVEESYIGPIYAQHHCIGARKLVVIASGMPSEYDEQEIAAFLHVHQYDVATFHFASTGKSRDSAIIAPEADLAAVIAHFKEKYETITVIGNSFGGYPALSSDITGDNSVTSVIAVSPVIHFASVTGIETLPMYLQKSYPQWYRFDRSVFETYIQNAPIVSCEHPEKITLIHGMRDPQIAQGDIASFCDTYAINLVSVDAGHLSLNRLSREHLSALASLI